jgi:hypothetical protein
MSLLSRSPTWRQPTFAGILRRDMPAHPHLPSRLFAETTRPGAAGNSAQAGPTLCQGRLFQEMNDGMD